MRAIVLSQLSESLLFLQPLLLQPIPLVLRQVSVERDVLVRDCQHLIVVFEDVILAQNCVVLSFEFLADLNDSFVLVVDELVLVLPQLGQFVELFVEGPLYQADDIFHHDDLVALGVVVEQLKGRVEQSPLLLGWGLLDVLGHHLRLLLFLFFSCRPSCPPSWPPAGSLSAESAHPRSRYFCFSSPPCLLSALCSSFRLSSEIFSIRE